MALYKCWFFLAKLPQPSFKVLHAQTDLKQGAGAPHAAGTAGCANSCRANSQNGF